jgi:hypothetical protein
VRVGARVWSVGGTARCKRPAASARTVDVAGTGIRNTGTRDTGIHDTGIRNTGTRKRAN